MTPPSAQSLYDVIDTSWPAAATHHIGPWGIRDGAGGGQRVSAATARRPIRAEELSTAEKAMQQLRQPRLFMIRDGDDDLDALLAAQGYAIKDPVTLMPHPLQTSPHPAPHLCPAFRSGRPLRSKPNFGQPVGSLRPDWP